MVPAVPTLKLSYVSPVQPGMAGTHLANSKTFAQRSGYLFFGYNNFANNEGLTWFANNVLANIENHHKLHIAGKVYVPSLCNCKNYNTALDCTARKPNIVCHGALSDAALDELIASSLVAINPVMEPSGVATKTCRAMAQGTPVVVTDQDGTFTPSNLSSGGKRCKFDDNVASCLAKHLNDLLNNEEKWKEASRAAPSFIAENYGAGQYKRDWLSIIQTVTETPPYQVLLIGNADFNGESLASQNWHMVNMLQKDLGDLVKVTVVADKFEPRLEGVDHALLSDLSNSPLETGYQADLVIRQNWPPDFSAIPASICGTGCRVANILPWEFGSLPIVWMEEIQKNVDWLWAPSEYNRLIYQKSGFATSSTAVAPAGVDCNTLLATNKTTGSVENSNNEHADSDSVIFLFTGGFIPRKGIDILVEEWHNVFCDANGHKNDLLGSTGAPNAKLIIQTSYELGFTKHEIIELEKTITNCNGLIEWKRGWMSRDDYLAMMRSADIYVAPFRSEGFGIPLVESLVLGKAVIATVGGTAADDYMAATTMEHVNEKTLYPVHADGAKCEKDPCRGEKLCVFPPCAYGSCTCEQLVQGPSWFEVNRNDLRKQMALAYTDISTKKRHASVVRDLTADSVASDNNAKAFCWDNLSPTYRNLINNAIKSPLRRTPTRFERPHLQVSNSVTRYWSKQDHQHQKFGLLLVFCLILLIFLWRKSALRDWTFRRVPGLERYNRVSSKER
jgi:glycosyltransferase involved in cell wall biosynthesis